jgi:coproporphyrinogen III oxidase
MLEHAMKIVDFVNETKELVIKKLLALSGGTCDRRSVPFKVGTADVSIIRGGCIEKAAITHMTMLQVQPPELDMAVDYMVFQVEIFPSNPNCPFGHFNTEWALTGDGPYHMNLDLFPAVEIQEDLLSAKASMDGLADRFCIDRVKLREGLDAQYNMPHWDKPLAAMVGCKLMHLHEDRLDLFIDAYRTFFDTYTAILQKRKDAPANDAGMQLKLRRNGKWLEYLTMKDIAVKMGLGVGIPADVIVNLSFPPSAAF